MGRHGQMAKMIHRAGKGSLHASAMPEGKVLRLNLYHLRLCILLFDIFSSLCSVAENPEASRVRDESNVVGVKIVGTQSSSSSNVNVPSMSEMAASVSTGSAPAYRVLQVPSKPVVKQAKV